MKPSHKNTLLALSIAVLSPFVLQGCGSGEQSTTAPAEAVGYVKASNTEADVYFGVRVALSADGSVLAVSAPRAHSTPGFAYVFTPV